MDFSCNINKVIIIIVDHVNFLNHPESWNEGVHVLCIETVFLPLCPPYLSPLFNQTQESLNPNNLEYWMEDIYTPGYDSLLKRKEAAFRRAKVCKIGALIAAATCTVILVIVVPICTMKSWACPDRVALPSGWHTFTGVLVCSWTR